MHCPHSHRCDAPLMQGLICVSVLDPRLNTCISGPQMSCLPELSVNGGVCTFRKRSDPFRTQTSDPWVDPLRPGKGSHSDRPRKPTQTGIRHPNQTGSRPHSDRAPTILTESIHTLPPCHNVNGMGIRFFLPWHGKAWVHQQLMTTGDSIQWHCGLETFY